MSARVIPRTRRRNLNPPSRLGWPGSCPDEEVSFDEENEVFPKKPARPKTRTIYPPNKRLKKVDNQEKEPQNILWVVKYAPSSCEELVVAPKRVQQVRQWIQNAIDHPQDHKLLILTGSPGVGKSTMIQCLADEMNLELFEWQESYYSSSNSKWLTAEQLDASALEQQAPLASFEAFLKQTGAAFSALELGRGSVQKRSIILLDDLPTRRDRVAEILQQHLSRAMVPTVLIYSDVSEGVHSSHDLEQIIGTKFLSSSLVTIYTVHGATQAKMKKVLTRIATNEGVAKNTNFDGFVTKSAGDIRYAINALQTHHIGGGVKESTADARDQKLSTFHALGKLLYAKRRLNCNNDRAQTDEERPPLDFNPEGVLEHCDMELSSALAFLQHNCIDFFTDVSELSNTFSSYSDAAFLNENRSHSYVYESIFPGGYVSSLTGRSLAAYNLHPTASKFRQLQAPRMYEIYRNRQEKLQNLHWVQSKLSLGSTSRFMFTNAEVFAFESFPYIKMILPGLIPGSLEQTNVDIQLAEYTTEQEAILADDDIEEFDEDNIDIKRNTVIKEKSSATQIADRASDGLLQSQTIRNPYSRSALPKHSMANASNQTSFPTLSYPTISPASEDEFGDASFLADIDLDGLMANSIGQSNESYLSSLRR